MINKLTYIISTETNPYRNLALEEHLLKNVGDEECILYLWQNERTIVIGKNQNPWKECRIAELVADNGKLVRRLSGGGAVFHDLGNLNFTFVVARDNYNVTKQLEVILEAVKQRGIPAENTGRNDISVEGRKFSGNAFYTDGQHCYHHGTILMNVDMSMLSHYLNVSRDKLISKGVESVRSRVANLCEYDCNLTIEGMKQGLLDAFGTVYGQKAQNIDATRLNFAEIELLESKFSSWDWIYGKKMEFNYSMSQRFSWGDVDLKLEIQSGMINACVIYSDSLEIEVFEKLSEALAGVPFTSFAMVNVIENMKTTNEAMMILKDIAQLITCENI